jgi:phasin family protein
MRQRSKYWGLQLYAVAHLTAMRFTPSLKEKSMSNNNLEQLANSQKANAEVMMTLVRSAFNGMEKLAALNLAASREFFNASVANTQQLMNVKDPKELAKINSALAQPGAEKMMEYARSLSDLAASMQKEITSVMEAQYSNFTKTASSAIEKTTASAPVGGDVFGAAMKLQASTKAYDNMTQMAKQMTDIAEANVKTASSATAKAAAATKKK